MKKFIKYPSIEQFRNVIKNIQMTSQYVGKDADGKAIYDNTLPLPTIRFTGTTKLHGTNAGVCYNKLHGLWAQSRNNIITVEKDNAGFAFFVESNKDNFITSIEIIARRVGVDLNENTITLYGEWCGPGIQKGVAISEIDKKRFFVFGAKVSSFNEEVPAEWIDTNTWHRVFGNPTYNDFGIYSIYQFMEGLFYIEIDFNNPALAQNELIKITEQVEAECPVAKAFGVSGIGEGVVWSAQYKDSVYRFKVKGEKHSATKVKKLAEVDVEKIKSIDSFVEYACTENRLNQAIEQVFTSTATEPDKKNTGDFIKWIMSDILKEETDTLVQNGLEPRDIGGPVAKKASRWFMEYLNTI